MVEKDDKTSEIDPVGKARLLLGKSLLELLDRSLAKGNVSLSIKPLQWRRILQCVSKYLACFLNWCWVHSCLVILSKCSQLVVFVLSAAGCMLQSRSLVSFHTFHAFHVFHVICMWCDASFSIRTTFFMSCRLSCPKQKTHHWCCQVERTEAWTCTVHVHLCGIFLCFLQFNVIVSWVMYKYLQTPAELDFWLFTHFIHFSLTSFSSLLRFYFKAKPVQNLKNVTKRYKWNSRMCLNMSAMTRETKPKPRLYTSHVGKKQLTHYMVIGVHTCSHWLDVKPLFSQIAGAAALYASRHRTEWLFSYS